jgi:hypothetical protein
MLAVAVRDIDMPAISCREQETSLRRNLDKVLKLTGRQYIRHTSILPVVTRRDSSGQRLEYRVGADMPETAFLCIFPLCRKPRALRWMLRFPLKQSGC